MSLSPAAKGALWFISGFILLALNSRDAGDINAQGQRLNTEYLRQSAAHASDRTFRFDRDGTIAGCKIPCTSRSIR